ncbi:MAG: lysophospholipid acyltransferase family protein [Paludibacter sp.]|nr:lysophospholipid acyltransferase family protein [Paludibacter sp.]
MLRLISIPFSILAYFLFFLYITIFHPISVITFRVFGYHAHKKVIDALYFVLLSVIYTLFSSAKIDFRAPIPEGKPIIFVANHQSLFDIMTMGWFLRRYHPKYVSKIELGRNIPSISYNLRHGGSVLIDRKDPRQALPALKQMGEYIQEHNRSVIIYPEGTRSRDGKPGHFSNNGLKILCKYAPDALVVPVTINNSWRVFRYGGFPFGLGNRIELIAHAPMVVKDYPFSTLFENTVKAIVDDIK